MFGDESENPVYWRLSNCSYCCCYRCQPSSSLSCPQDALFSNLWLCSVPISDASLSTLSPRADSQLSEGAQRPRGQWRGNSAPGDSWQCLETFSLSSLGDGYWHWVVTEHAAIHRARAPDRDCQEWPAQTPSCWGWDTLRSTWGVSSRCGHLRILIRAMDKEQN